MKRLHLVHGLVSAASWDDQGFKNIFIDSLRFLNCIEHNGAQDTHC